MLVSRWKADHPLCVTTTTVAGCTLKDSCYICCVLLHCRKTCVLSLFSSSPQTHFAILPESDADRSPSGESGSFQRPMTDERSSECSCESMNQTSAVHQHRDGEKRRFSRRRREPRGGRGGGSDPPTASLRFNRTSGLKEAALTHSLPSNKDTYLPLRK